MNTAKAGVRLLAEICRNEGIRQIVFSPGSRSAPLVMAFSQISDIECIVIPDERVAGYFALGMAQQHNRTVALVCTSGTAVLNLAPAICEAFYQQTPLLLLTADRPAEAIGKGENQAIDQKNIYGNFVKASISLRDDFENASDKEIFEVVTAIRETSNKNFGPVHINIPLNEPLYEHAANNESPKYTLPAPLSPATLETSDIRLSKKNMLLIGTMPPDKVFLQELIKLSERKDVVVVVETTSNQNHTGFIDNIDTLLALIDTTNTEAFLPELVVTMGTQIVSKKIKEFLKKNQVKEHFHVSVARDEWNSLNAQMFYPLQTHPLKTLEQFNKENISDSSYKEIWHKLKTQAAQKAKQYLLRTPFSDLKVFETIIKSFPEKCNIQYGNSTPVRYSNLFQHKASQRVNANRGTSGIDGCVSTAAGAAYANKGLTICVVGDVSFLYDSNALWNNYLSPDLRIIVVNNSGGNIFRVLDGPTKVNGFEKFFETRHNYTAKHLAAMYNIPYYFCEDKKGLDEVLETFYEPQNGRPAILEIKTDGVLSAEIYKGYFEFLRKV